jgi:hypothetical protein
MNESYITDEELNKLDDCEIDYRYHNDEMMTNIAVSNEEEDCTNDYHICLECHDPDCEGCNE